MSADLGGEPFTTREVPLPADYVVTPEDVPHVRAVIDDFRAAILNRSTLVLVPLVAEISCRVSVWANPPVSGAGFLVNCLDDRKREKVLFENGGVEKKCSGW